MKKTEEIKKSKRSRKYHYRCPKCRRGCNALHGQLGGKTGKMLCWECFNDFENINI